MTLLQEIKYLEDCKERMEEYLNFSCPYNEYDRLDKELNRMTDYIEDLKKKHDNNRKYESKRPISDDFFVPIFSLDL